MYSVRSLFATIIGLAIVIGACAGPAAPPSPGTKAGPGEAPVVLRIGTNDGPDRPAGGQITELAKRVDALSGGSLRIEPVWQAVEEGPNWDQRVARLVAKDTLDMGLIPSRAWDTEGVTSLQALSAPFLVTSDDLAAQVATSDLADQLLAGLDYAGVVGLALIPEGLRHPYGFGAPLLGPADYAGQTIRAPASAVSTAMLAALGAEITDADVDESSQAGMESGYAFSPPGIATGNVTFFAKINSLVISKAAYDRLTESHRDVLRDAADQTQAWVIQNMPADEALAQEFCDSGSTVVAATEADLAALETAVAPVYAELETVPTTRDLIAAIRSMRAGVPVAPAITCNGVAAEPSQAAEATAIDGTYKTSFTFADLQRSPYLMDAGELNDENWGDFTLTFDRGRIELAVKNDVLDDSGTGTYTVTGDKLRFELPTYEPNVTFGFRWKLSGDTLTLERDWDVGVSVVPFLVKPWTKVSP